MTTTEKGMTIRDGLTVSMVRKCHDWMDRQWVEIQEINNELPMRGELRVNVACQSGCAACCTYMVDTVEAEAIHIAYAIERTRGEDRIGVLGQLLSWEWEFLKWLEHNPRPEPIEISEVDGVPVASISAAHARWRVLWQVKRKACPFLNMPDYTCSIYDLRPATCRGHHAAYPPEGADPILRQPPDGCFTTQANVDTGIAPAIWQLNNELGENWSLMLVKNLDRYQLPWRPGLVLGIAVLEAGRERFSWPEPKDMGIPVPVLAEARKAPLIQLEDLK